METFYTVIALVLLLFMAAALLRVLRGPSPADRLMTAQLFGATGVAVLLLLAQAMNMPALQDVALVFALLALLVVVGFTRAVGTFASETEDSE